MARTVAPDQQIFGDIRRDDLFYVDKTDFVREWWNARDRVTLVLRPRRFGKTLMLSTVERFLSLRHAGRGDLFEGLDVLRDEKMLALQGTLPVVALSFADVKPESAEDLRASMRIALSAVFDEWRSASGGTDSRSGARRSP